MYYDPRDFDGYPGEQIELSWHCVSPGIYANLSSWFRRCLDGNGRYPVLLASSSLQVP